MMQSSKDVTRSNRPLYPTHNIEGPGFVPEQDPTPSRQPPIEPAKVVSGASGAGIKSADTPRPTFQLPESVSAREIQQQSFRYGGGRSGGSTKP